MYCAAGELADDACKARAAVGEDDSRLAVTAGVKELLAGRWYVGWFSKGRSLPNTSQNLRCALPFQARHRLKATGCDA